MREKVTRRNIDRAAKIDVGVVHQGLHMLTLDRIGQTAIDETTRKISCLRYVTRAEAEEATMMALVWLQENAKDFNRHPDPPLGLLYVCARFRAYRLRHEAFRNRSLNGIIEKAEQNGTSRELGEALSDRSFSLDAHIGLIDLLDEARGADHRGMLDETAFAGHGVGSLQVVEPPR